MNAITPCLGPIGGDPADQRAARYNDALDDDRDIATAMHAMIAGWQRQFSDYVARQIINNEAAFRDVRRDVPVALNDLLDLVRRADDMLAASEEGAF